MTDADRLRSRLPALHRAGIAEALMPIRGSELWCIDDEEYILTESQAITYAIGAIAQHVHGRSEWSWDSVQTSASHPLLETLIEELRFSGLIPKEPTNGD